MFDQFIVQRTVVAPLFFSISTSPLVMSLNAVIEPEEARRGGGAGLRRRHDEHRGGDSRNRECPNSSCEGCFSGKLRSVGERSGFVPRPVPRVCFSPVRSDRVLFGRSDASRSGNRLAGKTAQLPQSGQAKSPLWSRNSPQAFPEGADVIKVLLLSRESRSGGTQRERLSCHASRTSSGSQQIAGVSSALMHPAAIRAPFFRVRPSPSREILRRRCHRRTWRSCRGIRRPLAATIGRERFGTFIRMRSGKLIHAFRTPGSTRVVRKSSASLKTKRRRSRNLRSNPRNSSPKAITWSLSSECVADQKGAPPRSNTGSEPSGPFATEGSSAVRALLNGKKPSKPPGCGSRGVVPWRLGPL